MDVPPIDVLDALMRVRGFDLPAELLTELAPAVRDMWELGEQLELDLVDLAREER